MKKIILFLAISLAQSTAFGWSHGSLGQLLTSFSCVGCDLSNLDFSQTLTELGGPIRPLLKL